MSINAGDLSDLGTIQELVSGAWRPLHVDVPVFIKPLSGREQWQAEQVGAKVDTRLQIGWLPSIKPTMRLVCGSQVFVFKSVIDPDRRRAELVIECEEIFS